MPDGSFLWISTSEENGKKKITGLSYVVDGGLLVSHSLSERKLYVSNPPFESFTLYQQTEDGFRLATEEEHLELKQEKEGYEQLFEHLFSDDTND